MALRPGLQLQRPVPLSFFLRCLALFGPSCVLLDEF